MKNKVYVLDYIDENDFKKRERSLKIYNMLAYKKLMFEYYPSLRNGEFLGDIISQDKKEQKCGQRYSDHTDQTAVI